LLLEAGFIYPLLPLIAWLLSGTLKYAVNRVRYGGEARRLIGNGGFPSTHTSVVTSVTALIGFDQGWGTPLFGLAVAISYIVMIDAVGIRRAVGENAKMINRLMLDASAGKIRLRERQGHTRPEVLGGAAVGILLGWLASQLLS
jgi:acid phosphatase family membrane protein YuiD